MTGFIKIIGGAFFAALLFGSGVALAACPVGKDDGDTWCDNGTPWKCERCGSEYCSIIQPGSCAKDDAPFSASELFGSKKSPLLRYAQDDTDDMSGMDMDSPDAADDMSGMDVDSADDGEDAGDMPMEDSPDESGDDMSDMPMESPDQ